MVQIIVILLVSYIVVPLVDMALNEHLRYGVKLVAYILTLTWVIFTLVIGRL